MKLHSAIHALSVDCFNGPLTGVRRRPLECIRIVAFMEDVVVITGHVDEHLAQLAVVHAG